MAKLRAFFLTLLLCLCILPTGALAKDHTFVMDDKANLLTTEQRQKLKEDYTPLTEYLDVAFVTTNSPGGSTDSFCHSYVNREFGNRPAVIFAIDMSNRQIYVYSNEAALSIISRADARAITDNIYQYATDGDYYGCANEAFAQIQAKCEGGVIARPVKHITNALIAVVLGVLANYYLAHFARARLINRRGVRSYLRRYLHG